MLTIARRNEEIVHNGRTCSNKECPTEIICLIIKVEPLLKLFIGQEVASMGWNAAKCHNMRPFPKSTRAFLLHQCTRRSPKSQIALTCLQMCLDRIEWEHATVLNDTSHRTRNDVLPHGYVVLTSLPLKELVVICGINLNRLLKHSSTKIFYNFS